MHFSPLPRLPHRAGDDPSHQSPKMQKFLPQYTPSPLWYIGAEQCKLLRAEASQQSLGKNPSKAFLSITSLKTNGIMKRKDQILTLLKKQLPYLKKNFKVKSIGLFGSYAREEQTETSDIDMLVEFEAPVGFIKFMQLENYLSDKLSAKVDLVTSDALKPLIKPSIIEEAVYA